MLPQKICNLVEMDRFIKRHKLQKVTQEEIKYLNRPIISKEVEISNLKLPNRKSPGSNGW
jgi:hypothetical protein